MCFQDAKAVGDSTNELHNKQKGVEFKKATFPIFMMRTSLAYVHRLERHQSSDCPGCSGNR